MSKNQIRPKQKYKNAKTKNLISYFRNTIMI